MIFHPEPLRSFGRSSGQKLLAARTSKAAVRAEDLLDMMLKWKIYHEI